MLDSERRDIRHSDLNNLTVETPMETPLLDMLQSGPGLPRHITSMLDFSRETVERSIQIAEAIETSLPEVVGALATGRCMAVMFYQQSTRTRLSFEAAMQRLGGKVIGFADPTTTRAVGFYEETLEDMVRFTAAMSDLLVLRHPETGSSHRAAEVSPVPIINAGDGYGEHPTQSLGDVYHLHKHFGRIDGLTVGMVGHLGWRAHRSLAICLSLFDIDLVVLEPPGLDIPEDIRRIFKDRGTRYEQVVHIRDLLKKSDVVTTLGVYHTNFNTKFGGESGISQKQEAPTPPEYRITVDDVTSLGRFLPVMHMGPIADHIDRKLDQLPQAHYFRQARDGVWMRTALLASLLAR